MKTTFYKSTLLVLLTAGALTSCVNDDDYGVPLSALGCTETSLVKNMDPQQIIASADVQAYEDNTAAPGPDVIEAYVTSSDEGGNFFKTISFQTLDGSFGFSVPVDVNSTFINFEPGRKVFITLDGTYVDKVNGSLRIGDIYVSGGDAEVGRIPQSEYLNVLHRSCTVVKEEQLVRKMTIEEAISSDANINTLIELQGVQFTDAAINTTYYDPANVLGGATNHILTDAEGNTIIFRTSSFATYAGQDVPDGNGTVRGVLTKFGNDYQFMARTERDVQLTGTRITPLFQEDFQEAIDGTDFNIAGWVNYAQTGTRKWREEAFSGNGYAEFSSFGSGNASNVAWLVSPVINLDNSTDEALTFRTAQHHLDGDTDGNKLEVYIFTSFDGTNVTGATMVDITDDIALPTSATAWYAFVNSGAVDLSGYSGDIYIAFKFTGSGTNLALDGAFQIDDLTVTGSPE